MSRRIRGKIYCVSRCSQSPYLVMNVTVVPCFGILFPVRKQVTMQPKTVKKKEGKMTPKCAAL